MIDQSDNGADPASVAHTRLLLPVAGLFMALALAVGGVAWLAADAQDRQAIESMRRTLTSIVSTPKHELGRWALDHAYWDTFVENAVVDVDPKWVDDNIGLYAHESLGIDVSLVIDSADTAYIVSVSDRLEIDVPASPVPEDMVILVNAARASIGPVDAPPGPQVSYLRLEDRVFMASAAAVKWEDKIPPPQRPDAKGGSGLVTRVFLREIGAEMLATISDDYMIEGLVLITDGSAPAASILLPGPDGQVVARIGWTPSEPGTAFLEELVFPLAGALLVAGALLLLIVSRVRASVQRTLDAHRALQHRTRELREARDEAKRANEAKSEFLAQMSHDLRTPLNAILGFSEVIALQTFGTGGQATERYRDYARQIHAGGAHLRSLIDSILDVTRLDSGRYMITPAPIALDDVVHDCLALLRDGIEEKALSVDTPASALRVMADRSGLEQVLLNLIGNAVKYSGSGDRIRVTAKSSGEGAVISVADTGRGMAPEEVAHAFDLFTRGSSPATDSIQGTGVGLSIVKRIVGLHGGRVWIDSAPGQGTTVTFTVPLATPEEEPPALAASAG
jgi:signal transduction histidine kinase